MFKLQKSHPFLKLRVISHYNRLQKDAEIFHCFEELCIAYKMPRSPSFIIMGPYGPKKITESMSTSRWEEGLPHCLLHAKPGDMLTSPKGRQHGIAVPMPLNPLLPKTWRVHPLCRPGAIPGLCHSDPCLSVIWRRSGWHRLEES